MFVLFAASLKDLACGGALWEGGAEVLAGTVASWDSVFRFDDASPGGLFLFPLFLDSLTPPLFFVDSLRFLSFLLDLFCFLFCFLL